MNINVIKNHDAVDKHSNPRIAHKINLLKFLYPHPMMWQIHPNNEPHTQEPPNEQKNRRIFYQFGLPEAQEEHPSNQASHMGNPVYGVQVENGQDVQDEV